MRDGCDAHYVPSTWLGGFPFYVNLATLHVERTQLDDEILKLVVDQGVTFVRDRVADLEVADRKIFTRDMFFRDIACRKAYAKKPLRVSRAVFTPESPMRRVGVPVGGQLDAPKRSTR